MNNEQRKDALEALDTLAEQANKCTSVYVPDIAALKTRVLEALQSPPIPVIEELEGAIQLLIMIENSYSREAEECRLVNLYLMQETFKEKSNMIRRCVKAAEEYLKLQKRK